MPPMIRPDDMPAVLGMLKKTFQSNNRLQAANEAKRIADENQAAAVRDFELHRGAFAMFGFDPADPNMWNVVQEVIGMDAWNATGARADEEERMEWLADMANAPRPNEETVDEADLITEQQTERPLMAEPPSVREFVLGELVAAGTRGTTAATIRKAYETVFNYKLHEKTVGMTLYRLTKEKPPKARREKRTLFLASPKGETKNPGVDAPGQTSVFD